MTEHTPGPWWDESGVIHAKGPRWTPEDHSCVHVASHIENEADGALIAASPDLLAACKATEYADSLLSEWRARWQCTHSAEGVAAWNKWQMFDARARELRRTAIAKAEEEL